jgi:hypothetical protein
MESILEAHEDAKFALAAETLRGHGTAQLKAWGTSMLPSLWPGDLLTIEGVAHDDIVPGEIVLVLSNNRFLVHRLVEKRQDRDRVLWITRGDAMPGNDPLAAAPELLGRVARIRRGNRSFVPRRRVSPLRSLLAWVLCHCGRFRSLALRMHAALMQAGATHP